MFESKLVWLGLASVVVVYFAWKFTARSAYEAAEYRVVETQGNFELREYPELMTAATPMRFADQGSDGSFSRLFGYISGDNGDSEKIAMTVPVFMDPEGDGREPGKMAFVLPKALAERGAPTPANSKVAVEKRPAGLYAVYRFSGRTDETLMEAAEKKLRSWVGDNRWRVVSDLEAAGYDPPWTPGPLRRNEVLLRVELVK